MVDFFTDSKSISIQAFQFSFVIREWWSGVGNSLIELLAAVSQ
jgi:hypothetical protein